MPILPLNLLQHNPAPKGYPCTPLLHIPSDSVLLPEFWAGSADPYTAHFSEGLLRTTQQNSQKLTRQAETKHLWRENHLHQGAWPTAEIRACSQAVTEDPLDTCPVGHIIHYRRQKLQHPPTLPPLPNSMHHPLTYYVVHSRNLLWIKVDSLSGNSHWDWIFSNPLQQQLLHKKQELFCVSSPLQIAQVPLHSIHSNCLKVQINPRNVSQLCSYSSLFSRQWFSICSCAIHWLLTHLNISPKSFRKVTKWSICQSHC